jgi:hypothetical protein
MILKPHLSPGTAGLPGTVSQHARQIPERNGSLPSLRFWAPWRTPPSLQFVRRVTMFSLVLPGCSTGRSAGRMPAANRGSAPTSPPAVSDPVSPTAGTASSARSASTTSEVCESCPPCGVHHNVRHSGHNSVRTHKSTSLSTTNVQRRSNERYLGWREHEAQHIYVAS